MGNPYPAQFIDDSGEVRLSGEVNFDDPSNQPGAGALNSWLSSSWDHPITLPTDSTVATAIFDHPADGSFGNDITLSSDGQTFTLVNDGLYSFTFSAMFATDQTANECSLQLAITAAGANDLLNWPATYSTGVTAEPTTQPTPITGGTVYATGGTTFQVHGSQTASAGTTTMKAYANIARLL